MAKAMKVVEFFIDNNWVLHDQFVDEIDTYENLKARKAKKDQLSFINGVMVEINTIRHLGNEAIVKTTTTWI